MRLIFKMDPRGAKCKKMTDRLLVNSYLRMSEGPVDSKIGVSEFFLASVDPNPL